jgi:hypothetical protein
MWDNPLRLDARKTTSHLGLNGKKIAVIFKDSSRVEMGYYLGIK